MYIKGEGMPIPRGAEFQSQCQMKAQDAESPCQISNTALNILHAFIAEALHGDRPQVFTRIFPHEKLTYGW